MKKILILLLLPMAVFAQHPAIDDEFIGPFPSWVTVNGGDSITDATPIFQGAINNIKSYNSPSSVIYVPAGTYRFTSTVTGISVVDIRIVGAHPDSVRFIWDGPAGGTFFYFDGLMYSSISRISFDGKGVAKTAIDQSWSGGVMGFDTGNEYADIDFRNLEFGITGGMLGQGFAETAVMRCKFHNISKAGITTGNWNALDLWIWNCLFEDCNIGVTNNYGNYSGGVGAGNFCVYNSVFRRNNKDIATHHTTQCEFSFRDNTSTNSNIFYISDYNQWSGQLTIQSNKIINPISSQPIQIKNQGPVTMIDNIISTRSYVTAGAVFHEQFTGSDFISINNQFIVSQPIIVWANNPLKARLIEYDKPIVPLANLSGLTEQALLPTPARLNRPVFEIQPTATTAQIQSAINQASALNNRAIVHFPYKPHSSYPITETLIIPPGSDVQLVGDGGGDNRPTLLKWIGSGFGPVIHIQGPSKATLRDFSINGSNSADNILISDVDQVGARVFMHQVENHLNSESMIVNQLNNTRVLAYNSRWTAATTRAVNVIGGPAPALGRTILYGGLMWSNELSVEVSNGGNLLVRDVWYESQDDKPFLRLSDRATVSVDGSRVATGVFGTAIPAVQLNNFNGKATFIGNGMADRISIKGNGANTKVLALSNLSQTDTSIVNQSFPLADARSFHQRAFNYNNGVDGIGSNGLPNIGIADSTFFVDMLESTRNVHAEVLTPTPVGVSDVRMYRVWTMVARKGMEITGGATVLSNGFSSFTAACKNGNVELKWAPLSNTSNYVIEESENGYKWVSSEITSATNFIDNTPAKYYRIKAVNSNQNAKYSQVVKSPCTETKTNFNIYPNPVKDFATVSITSSKTEVLKMKLINALGAVVKEMDVKVVNGINPITIDLKQLSPGTYYLTSNNEIKNKVMKQ